MSEQLKASMNNPLKGFNLVAGKTATTLILGSMPGVVSLKKHQYYAHPRNAFWPIIRDYCSFSRGAESTATDYCMLPKHSAQEQDKPYEAQLAELVNEGFALWDVVSSCVREGSLDANIRRQSVQVNDFQLFFERYPGVRRVLFNGKTAAALFQRFVLPKLFVYNKLFVNNKLLKNNKLDATQMKAIKQFVLPSTSPANARMSLEEKKAIWLTYLSPSNEPTDGTYLYSGYGTRKIIENADQGPQRPDRG